MTVESLAPTFNIVIASVSEAIHGRKARAGLLRRFAPRNDVDGHGVSPNDHVVPALRRDPYAVCSRFGSVADALPHNPRQGLWVPARRPGRREWVVRIHFSNSNLCADTIPHSRDIIRPSFANSFAPQNREGAGDPQERAQGRPGARCTRGLMCKDALGKNAHEHTGSAEAVRPSLRSGFTAYLRALPGETRACLSPSSPRSVSFPGI
jgi:hypothetical protein